MLLDQQLTVIEGSIFIKPILYRDRRLMLVNSQRQKVQRSVS